MAVSKDKRPWGDRIAELLSIAFWGGISSWVITHFIELPAPLIGSVSALFGWLGYVATIGFIESSLAKLGIPLHKAGQ